MGAGGTTRGFQGPLVTQGERWRGCRQVSDDLPTLASLSSSGIFQGILPLPHQQHISVCKIPSFEVGKDNHKLLYGTVAPCSWSCTGGRAVPDQPVPQQLTGELCCIYCWITFNHMFSSKQRIASSVLRDECILFIISRQALFPINVFHTLQPN